MQPPETRAEVFSWNFFQTVDFFVEKPYAIQTYAIFTPYYLPSV